MGRGRICEGGDGRAVERREGGKERGGREFGVSTCSRLFVLIL